MALTEHAEQELKTVYDLLADLLITSARFDRALDGPSENNRAIRRREWQDAISAARAAAE